MWIVKVAHHLAAFNVHHNLCSFSTHRAQLISDKNGIRITSDYQFKDGELFLLVYKWKVVMLWKFSIPDDHLVFKFCLFLLKQRVVKLKVENTGTEAVYFTYYTPLHKIMDATLMDEHKVTKTNPLCLKPGNVNMKSLYFLSWGNIDTISHCV